jgi:hypothetical protein
MAEAALVNAGVSACKTAVVDVAVAIIRAVNDIRRAALEQQELQGKLGRLADAARLVQTKAELPGVPATQQGRQALQQLLEALQSVNKDLQVLQEEAAKQQQPEGECHCLSKCSGHQQPR